MNLLSGIMFFVIAIQLDYNFIAHMCQWFIKQAEDYPSEGQNLNETNQSNTQDIENDESAAVVHKLLKTYKNIFAIQQKSLNDEQIAAGKRIKFKMITGDTPITAGDIWIKRNCQKTQFDNFILVLTIREILKIFALIVGYKMDEINETIKNKATEFKIQKQLDTKIKICSPEDRKKLIAALAQLGNQDVILLNVRLNL